MSLFYLLTLGVCAGYVVLMARYLYNWKSIPAWNPDPVSVFKTRVTVIIPARNEEKNIANCLRSVFSQQFPVDLFEVIVVDDHSSDQTREIVKSLQHVNLKLINLPQNLQGKKNAIAEGIKNASGDLIITTDADCRMGKLWLQNLVSFYEEKNPKMIIGVVLLEGERSLQQKMQSQEMIALTACAGGAATAGSPVLCSGANLAYEKKIFDEVGGFDNVNKTSTGDDMFLMLKLHRKFPGKIGYLRSADAVVYTHPEDSSVSAVRQRKRWASKTFLYGGGPAMWVAILIFLTNFLIFFSGIMSAINLKFAFIAVISFFAKFLADFMIVTSASTFFGKKFYPLVFLISSVIYPVYVSFIGLVSPFTNYSWKSRRS